MFLSFMSALGGVGLFLIGMLLLTDGLKALIVDLRSNPGGILDSAVLLANRFIEEGTIVATRTRRDTRVTEAELEEAHLLGLPLVLLVDSSSASASEVLAGALQDHCVAAIIGESTYGKGTVQTLERFASDRAIVKLTTATYFTPSWRSSLISTGATARSGTQSTT